MTRKTNTVSIGDEYMEKLIQIQEAVEEDIYYSLPENDKYHPQITYRQIIQTLIDQELARLRGEVK